MKSVEIGMLSRRAARAAGWFLALTFAALAAAGPGPAHGFDLQGHRGARGLAPENTLAGFATALRVGVTTLELDLGVTRDGHLVVAHDPRLNLNLTRDADGRFLEATGPAIHSLNLAQLQRYDVGRLEPGTSYARDLPQQQGRDGERIPTLATLFERVAAWRAGEVRFNIETKINPLEPELAPSPQNFARLVVDALRRHGLTARATVQSFDWRTLREVQRIAPEVATVALTARRDFLDNVGDPRWTAGERLDDHGGSLPRMVKAIGASAWSPFHRDLAEPLVTEAHALGLKVVPWTVNDPARIEQLLDWNVDGLISDYPDRVRAALARRGLPLPDPVPAALP